MDETAFGQNTSNPSDKDVVLGHAESRRRKRGFGWLVLILGVMGVVIVGLVVWLIVGIIGSDDQYEAKEPKTKTEILMEYVFDKKTMNDVEYLINDLISVIDNSDNQDEAVNAAIELSVLYSKEDAMVLENLEKVLERDLTEKNQYIILSRLMTIYDEFDDRCGQKQILTELVKLPDDIVIEREDWPMMKQYWQRQLDALLREEEEYGEL